MGHCCYIIFSPSKNRYYVGACKDFTSRLNKHNAGEYGKSTYTTFTADWEPYLSIDADDFSHARRLELKIKKMKSRVYIKNLKKYPEMVERIKNKCRT
ncbi:MAG: GIY-YIG nuclease family protein [Bacteroidota bacterium]